MAAVAVAGTAAALAVVAMAAAQVSASSVEPLRGGSLTPAARFWVLPH